MKEISIDGKTRRIAESLDELTPRQFLAFVRIAYMRYHLLYVRTENGGYKLRNLPLYYTVRISLLYVLLQVRPGMWRRFTPEQVHSLLEEHRIADFFFHGTRTKRPFACLRAWRFSFRTFIRRFCIGTRLYAPDETFEHLLAEEWCFVDTFYLRYKKSGTATDLNTFLALFLRPRSPHYAPRSPYTTGDVREPFNKNTEHYRTPAIGRWPMHVRLAIFLWYEGYRQSLKDSYPHVFTPKVEGEAAQEGSDMLTILLSMAGKKFGPHQDTILISHKLFLKQMDNDIKDYKAAMRPSKKPGGH